MGLQSCYKDKFDFKNINDTAVFSPNLGLPVAYGQVTLRNLVKARKDTLELYQETGSNDTLIRLVYNIDTISQYKASQFLKPPKIAPIERSIKMPGLVIPDQNNDTTISFNSFVTTNFPSKLNYYSTITTVVPVNQSLQEASKPIPFTKFGTITWVYTLTGKVILSLTNNFDVPLTTDVAVVANLSVIQLPLNTIGTFHFSSIQPGQTAHDTIDISGSKVSNVITYEFKNTILESKTTSINMNKTLGISIVLGSLSINAGKAIIPPQVNTFLSKDTIIFFTLDTYKGKKLTQLDVYKGSLQFSFSYIPGMNLTLELPSVVRYGQPVSISTSVINPKDSLQLKDLSGYSMDLSTNPSQRYNSLPVRLKYNIDSKGLPVSFDNTVTKDFKVKITNPDSLQFEYVQGQMGQDTVDIGSKTFNYNIDQFIGNFFQGNVTFTDPRLFLNFTNSIGMSASTNMQLTGQTKDGKQIPLFNPVVFHTIDPATIAGSTAESTISILNSNSNIVNLISSLPHTMLATGKFITNYGTPDAVNFITRESIISAQLHAELPLKFSMKDVILRQEFPISAGSFSIIDSLDNSDEFKIVIYTKNQFPLDVTVKLYLIDSTSNNKVLETLNISVIKAATADQYGKVQVNQFTRHREEKVLSKANTPTLVSSLKKANKLRFEAVLNTYNQKSVTIYTFYSVSFQLGIDAKIKYKTSLGITPKK